MSSGLPTPTRTLVETSVGVREAARSLQKLSIHWECPKQVVIIVKPDGKLVEKAQLVIDHLLKHNMIVFVEDTVYPRIKKTCQEGEIKVWNANSFRKSLLSLRRSSVIAETPVSAVSSVDGDGTVAEDAIFNSHQHSLNKFTTTTALPLDTPSKKSSAGLELSNFDPEEIDIVITLGGDGTVLHASWLFQTVVPPLLPFHLGTLGFLTVFDFRNYKSRLDSVLLSNYQKSMDSIVGDSSCLPGAPSGHVSTTAAGGRRVSITTLKPIEDPSPLNVSTSSVTTAGSGVRITLRMRFTCAVYRSKTILTRKQQQQQTEPSHASTSNTTDIPDPDDVFQILNDLVVDRGPSPFMSSLEVFGDGKHLTTVQADGLVVSTPTGSTAYSLSAGGSMVHPEVPAILVTPICPHTLSFRPMLLPDSMELKIVVPHDSRSGAWASFDGRHRLELHKGDAIVITASTYPVPTLCRIDQTKDWFDSLGRCLRWNERARQKSFVWGQGVVEEKERQQHQ